MREAWGVGLGWSWGASNLAFSNNQPLPAGCLSVLVFPGNLTFSRQPYTIYRLYKKRLDEDTFFVGTISI